MREGKGERRRERKDLKKKEGGRGEQEEEEEKEEEGKIKPTANITRRPTSTLKTLLP